MKAKNLLYLLVMMLFAIPSYGADWVPPWVTSATADLDGNGTRESIQINIAPANSGKYTLRVGQASVNGRLDEGVDGFEIIDIDPTDHYKEIAVHTSGPSDDPAYSVYWFDGKNIHEAGELPGAATFPGNNTVLATVRINFAFTTEKYVLTKQHTLKAVPQEVYFVGTPENGKFKELTVTVKKSFPIRYSRDSKEVVANLQPGSKVAILGYWPAARTPLGEFIVGDKDQYLIRSHTGLMGWASQTLVTWDNFEDLPAFD